MLNPRCDVILFWKYRWTRWGLGQLCYLFHLNYLSQSPWGSLLESPWTDLTWISSPSHSCSIWTDTPVHTCREEKTNIYLHSDLGNKQTTGTQLQIQSDTSVFTLMGPSALSAPSPQSSPTFHRSFVSRIINDFNQNQTDESTRVWLNQVDSSGCVNSWWGGYSVCSHTTCRAEPPTYVDKNVGLAGVCVCVCGRFRQTVQCKLLTLSCRITTITSPAFN